MSWTLSVSSHGPIAHRSEGVCGDPHPCLPFNQNTISALQWLQMSPSRSTTPKRGTGSVPPKAGCTCPLFAIETTIVLVVLMLISESELGEPVANNPEYNCPQYLALVRNNRIPTKESFRGCCFRFDVSVLVLPGDLGIFLCWWLIPIPSFVRMINRTRCDLISTCATICFIESSPIALFLESFLAVSPGVSIPFIPLWPIHNSVNPVNRVKILSVPERVEWLLEGHLRTGLYPPALSCII